MFQTTNQIYIYCHNKSPYVNPQPCSMCRDTVAETRPLWPSPGYASRGWLGALLPEMVFQHGQCPIPQRKKLIDWPFTIWLVVDLPLWKIWKSVGMMIPNIWENKIHVMVVEEPNRDADISWSIQYFLIIPCGWNVCFSKGQVSMW